MMQQKDSSAGPHLCVEPAGRLLMDDSLEFKILGLVKQQKTTVHTVIREGNSVFESCCCFTADDYGEVNMATQPSQAGSYIGVSPMGIFWSMVQAPGQKDGLRLVKKDTSLPVCSNIRIFDGHLTVDTIHTQDLEPLCTASVERWYRAPGVRREVVRVGRIRGAMYLPPGSGPFPGVIDMFGTVGGIFEFRAALLASRGFACLSLPYFHYEDLPQTLNEVDFDYFMEAIAWLCSHKDVFHDGIGAVGVSRGADIAQLMAAYSPKIACVVSINGCSFNATYRMKYKDGFIEGVPIQLDKMYEEEGVFVCNRCWEYSKEDLIPVWNYDAKILSIVGEDDKLNPWECVKFLKDNLPPEKSDNFQIVSYKGAGHLIEPPFTPLCRMSYHKSYETKFLWGGYPEPHAYAQEDSWRRILEHLHKYIPRTSKSDSSLHSKL